MEVTDSSQAVENLTRSVAETAPLTREQIEAACAQLLDETIPIEDRAAFLDALHTRGETPEEIAAFVEILLSRANVPPVPGEGCIDVCGTGGDHAGFFNISTTAMFIAAGAGARVLKHGNRGITSKSGGADVLEALGIRIDTPFEKIPAALEAAGCCFLFAPACHPAFKAVVPVRKLLASRGRSSIFNILGPLLNPCRPSFQLAGVFDPRFAPAYAAAFEKLGRRRAWAVHGTGPGGMRLDEVSPLGKTLVEAVENGARSSFEIHPAEFGIGPIEPAELLGGDASENAAILRGILDGTDRGPGRPTAQLNAAAALAAAGTAPTLEAAWKLAGESIDSGRAALALAHLREATQ
jgi:anthranilate phosphoribosyltransferase